MNKARLPISDLSKSELVHQLRNQIRAAESVGRIDGQPRVSSGCSAIDRLLPGCGYQRGSLVQWLTGGGQAADYLSLMAAKEACADGGALVVFDPDNEFYPPAAAAIGLNLDNLIVLKDPTQSGFPRPMSGRFRATRQDELSPDLMWSIDQAMRCPAVAAVWGPIGIINERWFRRFQLSAESSGCLGLFVQPISQARQPSWADVQWLVQSPINPRAISCNQRESEASSEVSAAQHLRSSDGASVSRKIRPQKTLPQKALDQETNQARPGAKVQNTERSGIHDQREQQVRLQLARCRGTQTGKSVNLSINTITGNVQLARSDYGQSTRQVRNEKRDSDWQKTRSSRART